MIVSLPPIGGPLTFGGRARLGHMTSTAAPVMQKADLDAVSPDAHGLISKQTAELDGVSVTRVRFDVGARWSNDLKDMGERRAASYRTSRSCLAGACTS